MRAFIIVNDVLAKRLYVANDFGSLTANLLEAKLYSDISTARLYAKDYESIIEVVIVVKGE